MHFHFTRPDIRTTYFVVAVQQDHARFQPIILIENACSHPLARFCIYAGLKLDVGEGIELSPPLSLSSLRAK